MSCHTLRTYSLLLYLFYSQLHHIILRSTSHEPFRFMIAVTPSREQALGLLWREFDKVPGNPGDNARRPPLLTYDFITTRYCTPYTFPTALLRGSSITNLRLFTIPFGYTPWKLSSYPGTKPALQGHQLKTLVPIAAWSCEQSNPKMAVLEQSWIKVQEKTFGKWYRTPIEKTHRGTVR